jgi:predicted ATPase
MAKRVKKPLRFTHIRLENWRNFTEVETPLERRVFLVGPNASGKSNFLDAFRFLRDLVAVGGGFQEAVRHRGGVSRLRCLAARRSPAITVHVRVGTDEKPSLWEYELRFHQDARHRPAVKRERVVRDGTEVIARPNKHDETEPERLTQTHLEQVYVNQEFRELADFFPTVQYLHVVPQLIREPNRSVGQTEDPFGGDFLERVAKTPERTRRAWLKRILDALRVAVPQFDELKLLRDDRGIPHVHGRYKHWRPRGAWQTEDQFSDGTLRLMGLLWIALDGNGPLLLEEPELSLHPEVVRHIPQMFARMQRRTGRQVMVSTHSADLLRDPGIGLNEVLVLEPSDEGTIVQPVSAIQEARHLLEGGLTLADIVIPRTGPTDIEQLTLFEK